MQGANISSVLTHISRNLLKLLLVILKFSNDNKFYCLEVLPSVPEVWQSCLLKSFLRICILFYSDISLSGFPSRTDLRLHNIPVTLKLVITDLVFSVASDPNCIPVVVLKNYGPELSYIETDVFNI